jgi:hypothetical protein
MSRKLWVTVSVVALLAVVLGAVVMSAGASPEARSIGAWGRGMVENGASATTPTPLSHEGADTFVVRGREVAGKEVNVNGRRFGPGDYFLFKERLTNRAGTRVGTDNIICTVHFPFTHNRFGTLCEGTFTFSGRGGIERGTISVQDVLVFREGVRFRPSSHRGYGALPERARRVARARCGQQSDLPPHPLAS